MVFNATFNNISIISWDSVLLAEETRVPGENHRPVTSYWQTLSHNVASSYYNIFYSDEWWKFLKLILQSYFEVYFHKTLLCHAIKRLAVVRQHIYLPEYAPKKYLSKWVIVV
jgi:uncharacterized protein YjlB